MKKIKSVLLFIVLIHFLSGCSQSYRSNAHQIPQVQTQAQHQVQYNKPKVIVQPKTIAKPRHSSQQSRTNAVTSQQQARNRISRIAHSTIGAPYKWGGNNPQQGFDCSGLMSYVHKNALGIKIPRTAAQQRDSSRTISYAQLQPGDMLFFKTGRNSNHVGVYVGNREFVHAATGSKKVRKVSMDNPYWHKRFVKFGTFL